MNPQYLNEMFTLKKCTYDLKKSLELLLERPAARPTIMVSNLYKVMVPNYGSYFQHLIKSLWRLHMETFSALLALCAGNPPLTGEFPSQSFDVFLGGGGGGGGGSRYCWRPPEKPYGPSGWWRYQAITLTDVEVAFICTNFQSFITIQRFSLQKMHLEMFAKWRSIIVQASVCFTQRFHLTINQSHESSFRFSPLPIQQINDMLFANTAKRLNFITQIVFMIT